MHTQTQQTAAIFSREELTTLWNALCRSAVEADSIYREEEVLLAYEIADYLDQTDSSLRIHVKITADHMEKFTKPLVVL